jgi:peptidoglycan/xylan/chitin deacetylase (PgdA/CDA1 family)
MGFATTTARAITIFSRITHGSAKSWTKVDYSKPAAQWMKPLVRGKAVDLVEISGKWYIEQLWRDQFDWVYREYDWAVFPLTIHPDVSGRPQVLLMLERLIEYISGHLVIRWCTMEEMAQEFRSRHPFKS